MKIKRIEVKAFAGLKNFTMDFSSGLNLLYGPNESGKTSLLNFIVSMFYGVGTLRGEDPFRKRVTPRDGSFMGGKIIFEAQGQDYVLQRSFGERPGLDETHLLNQKSNQEVELVNPDQPGLELFSLSENVFKNTLFIGAEGPEVETSTKLSNEIWEDLTAIMVNPDSDISINEVKKNLEDYEYKLKSRSGRKGEIPDLEQQLADKKQERYSQLLLLEGQSQRIEDLENSEVRLNRLTEEKAKLELAERVAEYLDNKEKLQLLKKPREKLKEKLDTEAKLKNQLKIYGDSSEEIRKHLTTVKEALEEYEHIETEYIEKSEALDDYAVNQANRKSKNWYYFIIISLLLALIAGLSFALTSAKYALIVLGISALVLVLLAIVIAVVNFKINKKVATLRERFAKFEKDYEEKKQNIKQELELYAYDTSSLNTEKVTEIEDSLNKVSELNQYLAINEKEIEDLKTEILNYSYTEQDLENLSKELNKEKEILSKYKLNVDELDQDRYNKNSIKEKRYRLENELSSVSRQLVSLETQLAQLSKNSKTGEAVSLQEQLFSIEDEIDQLEYKLENKEKLYRAVKLAEEILEKSLEDLRQGLLPKLNILAGEYLQVISEGKYDSVIITDELELQLEDNETSISLKPNNFSSGTSDQLWFSYRLALIKYLGKDKKYCIFLDDLFISFDDNRCQSSIKLLENLAKKEDIQVLCFTCHKDLLEKVETREAWSIKQMRKL